MAMMIVGLTGGIGSGKTSVSDHFSRLGAAVIDTDTIAHELTGPDGAAMPALIAEFGADIAAADGRLDRALMRQRVFADPAARRRLQSILHPLIRSEADGRLAAAELAGAPYAVLVVPLLVESADFRQRVDRVAVVDCADELRIARVAARSGLGRAEIMAIMATQASRSERLAIADDLIRNEGSLAELQLRVENLHRRYLRYRADTGGGTRRKA